MIRTNKNYIIIIIKKTIDGLGVNFEGFTYMSSSFWLLGVESRDFSHAGKERTDCKADQIHKMTIIFTQNGHRLSF